MEEENKCKCTAPIIRGVDKEYCGSCGKNIEENKTPADKPQTLEEAAVEYAKKCDPLNRTIEKQADIMQGFKACAKWQASRPPQSSEQWEERAKELYPLNHTDKNIDSFVRQLQQNAYLKGVQESFKETSKRLTIM